jgi:hypothetical protein
MHHFPGIKKAGLRLLSRAGFERFQRKNPAIKIHMEMKP